MSYVSFVPYNGEVWSYVFVDPDIFGISDEDRAHLMWNIVDLHKNSEKTRDIEGENYEGRVRKEKYTCLGGLSGLLFEAELETPAGKRKPKIILLETVNASLN